MVFKSLNMYKQKPWSSLFLFFLLISTCKAQEIKFVSVDKSWQEVSQVEIGIGIKTNTQNGKGVFFTKTPNAILNSDLNLKQHVIKLEFMQSNNGKAILVLHENVKIILNAGSDFFGTVDLNNGKNVQPLHYTERAPGLWQTLKIIYDDHGIGGKPTLELVELNDIKIHENVILSNLKNDDLRIVNTIGAFAIRNISQNVYDNSRPVSISNLSYIKLKNTEASKVFLNSDSFTKGESIDKITIKLPGEIKDSIIVFKGDLAIEHDDNYTFSLEYFGRSSLFINDKLLVGGVEEYSRIPQIEQIFLKKGKHKLVLKYQKDWRTALGLKVSGANFRPYILNDPFSLPIARAVGGVFIRNITGRPRVIRSFMKFNDQKRTAVISVGSQEGIHYAIDLEKANLLYAWKGEFADLTDMWFERGEPQVLMPIGLKIQLSGSNPLARDEEIKYESFVLDSEGVPSFNFSCSKGGFTQRYIPKSKGLNVSMKLDGFNTDMIVAEGKEIKDLGKNFFKVDDYYVNIQNAASAKIITLENIKKIVIFNQKDLNYTLSW